MTKNKRFWSEDYSVGYYTEIIDNSKKLADVPNPKKNLTIEENVDLLNKLYEENMELKADNKYLKERFKEEEWHYNHIDEDRDVWRYKCNQFEKENTKLKLQNEELLYQIGEVGKNNKTCRECECFIPECNICYMWDMEVEADDVVVACDQRKVKM